MKIRKLSSENYPRAVALLGKAFPGSNYETKLFEKLHANEAELQEWVCIHVNKVAAYICFSNAYDESDAVCGLHLAPLAVKPEFQGQGIGSELLRFALRQKEIKEKTLYVLGDPGFYKKFGFEPCANPTCPYDRNNEHFLSIRNDLEVDPYTVGYESEF